MTNNNVLPILSVFIIVFAAFIFYAYGRVDTNFMSIPTITNLQELAQQSLFAMNRAIPLSTDKPSNVEKTVKPLRLYTPSLRPVEKSMLPDLINNSDIGTLLKS